MSGWIYFYAGIAFSMLGSPLLKYSNGFEKPVYGIIGSSSLILATFLWGMSIRTLPLGTAYVLWSAISTIILALVGYMFFDEQFSALKIFFMLVIVSGCIGLKLVTER
ncbi:MAG: QacE family quaternary ammonium compound efflux SMR transporter [Proteobacteria bacterium]|nr:QacE family quaternary ammonium compound efflux SMR transporter [Pseudomonadota bacterium]